MEEVQVGGREINYASQGNYLDPKGAYMHAVLVHVGLVLSIDNCMEGRQESHTCRPNQFDWQHCFTFELSLSGLK